MIPQSWIVSLLVLTTAALAKTLGPVSTITISNKNISPDGFTRSASVINDIHPGPVITAKKGDKMNIRVVNKLTDPQQLRGLSMYWHGLLQKGTSPMDGVVGVTQCPIAPGNSFLYSFTADAAGTFWYHSHFGIQYCDGVRGALVVYDHEDPHKFLYDVDDESTIITLTEWYHLPASSVPGIPMGDSVLINGKGRVPGGPKVDLAVVNVRKGKRYRFRLFAMSCEANFKFSIDGHDLTVIEADGTETEPHTVNTIQMLVGQRYSVVLNANQEVGNYWIRALPNLGLRNLTSTFENGVNSAILRYKGAHKADPDTSQQAVQHPLNETDLHPLWHSFPPGEPDPNGVDHLFNMNLKFDTSTGKFSVNDTVYTPPTVPILLQIMSGAHTAQELLPEGSVFVVEKNKTVQVNFPSALIGGPHPFHLHGHTFSVVKSADSDFNFMNPIVRDTVSIGNTEGDFVSIRFKTDNPGPWIIHCHIGFHLVAGLAFVFAEAPDQIVQSLQPPPSPEFDKLCPTWDALPDSVKTAEIVSPSA